MATSLQGSGQNEKADPLLKNYENFDISRFLDKLADFKTNHGAYLRAGPCVNDFSHAHISAVTEENPP